MRFNDFLMQWISWMVTVCRIAIRNMVGSNVPDPNGTPSLVKILLSIWLQFKYYGTNEFVTAPNGI